MTIESINPQAIQKNLMTKGVKAQGTGFSDVMNGIGAMAPAGMMAAQSYSSSTPNAVITAAFSGVQAAAGIGGGGGAGGGSPYMSAGFSGNLKGVSVDGSASSASVIPGTDNFSQMDMVNTMNQNNLQLLELQATMQNNMQGWNTKSNILSADHRARMAMIEKFTTR